MAPESALAHDAGPPEDENPAYYRAIVPDPRDPEPTFDKDGEDDDDPQPATALQRWVDDAFANGYERYLNWIGPLLDARAVAGTADADPPEVPQSRQPSLAIGVSADWRPGGASPGSGIDPTVDTEEIVFDGNLVATLLELYILDGWQPLVTIGTALQRKLDTLKQLRESSGGTSPAGQTLAPWEPVAWLFCLARNGVALIVREELAAIETLAGVRLEGQIAESQTRFAALDGELKWQTIEADTGMPTKTGETKTKKIKQLEDRSLAETLAKALGDAVRCRRVLDLTLRDLARLDAYARRSAQVTASQKRGGQLAQAVASGRASTEKAVEQARALADAAAGQLRRNSPLLLLLIFPSLKPDFGTADMEKSLYDRVTQVRSELAELREKVRPDAPYTSQLVRGVDVAKQAPLWSALLDVEREVAPPSAGVESDMAARAVTAVGNGDTSWFPLISEKTLHELVAREQIETDSLTYVVYAHYVQALGEHLDQKLAAEAQSTAFWLRFSQLTAAASLTSLLTPETAPAAVPLRVATWVADIVLFGYSVWSVTDQLRRIQRLRDQAMAESSSALDALGQLGDLLAVRQDILAGLAEDAIVLLLTTLVGLPDIQLTRRALLAYSYYQDLQTLVAVDGPAEE